MSDAGSASQQPAGIVAREAELLAVYAMHSADTAGRKYSEPLHAYRGPFQRDRDRIVHSAAFRRLSHKTQVFMGALGDYHRSRLTHTLEAASIARSLARALRLNEDLVEALALMHDIGHPPFGHAGEDTLDECLEAEGGFSHNRQALRIVEHLERRYQGFRGLNLSIEVLESQQSRTQSPPDGLQPLLEAQVVDAADSVAYDTHDADDALEFCHVNLDELLEIQLWHQAAVRVKRRHSSLDTAQLRRSVLHELIEWQVGDLLEQSSKRIREQGIESASAARRCGRLIIPSDELSQQKIELERFLHERVYRHPQVLQMRAMAQAMLREMFAGYLRQPELLGENYRQRAVEDGLPRAVGDYLAGMTDRFVEREYARLFGQRSRDMPQDRA